MKSSKLGLFGLALWTLVLLGLAHNLTSDEAKNLLDEFRKAGISRRLELLPRLTKAYAEKELPPEARYLLALQLLRPHLSWHAPNLVLPKEVQLRERRREWQHGSDGWRWSEALGAETWMFADVGDDVRERARQALAAWKQKPGSDNPKFADPGNYAWRLKDPRHPDVTRAVRLLSGIAEGDLAAKSRRWIEEIGRNNTVLTLDVTGSYGVGKPAPVTLDARNAPRVTCKLFRVRRPEDLLWVAKRIGTDYVFKDHALQYRQLPKMFGAKELEIVRDVRKEREKPGEQQGPVPEQLQKDAIWQFELVVADLKIAWSHRWERRRWYDEDTDYREGDGKYFGDDCDRFSERLGKSYQLNAGRWTSWQCDRVIEVPGKVLAEAGAYVLSVESGGQTVYAPLIVEPLSLTLRRCRDGVFVAVADMEGKQPIAGATVHGRDMLGNAATDSEGISFAKLYAGGARPILVHKDGRFAIGGFGRVFEGIYVSPLDRYGLPHRWGKMMERKEEKVRAGQAQVYTDRHVVAAYTARPTYRPDQEVQFKVILRRLAPDQPAPTDRPQAFRAEDFEFVSRLEIPGEGTRVPFALLDPKGRAVAEGELILNDFGTAAGTARLNAEAAVGTYALRLRLAGIERIVPEFCAVEYYRLPSFKLDVKGVPEKVRKPEAIRVELTGAYYFGKPLVGGRVEVALLTAGNMRKLSSAEAVLDSAGNAVVKLEPGKNWTPGRYVVRCDLCDDSGRSVQRVLPYLIEAPERPRTGLGALPRFVPRDQPLEFPTSATVVLAENDWIRPLRFVPREGKATLRLPTPGWYRLSAGQDHADVFVYGGTDLPSGPRTRQQDKKPAPTENDPKTAPDEASEPQAESWVDLTDDREDQSYSPLFNRRSSHLLALFDRQEAKVGDRLRVLVHVPARRARLLFTLEGFTVLDYFTAQVDSKGSHYHVIEIPITSRHLPHFYLRGRILHAEDMAPEWTMRDEAGERLQKLREDGAWGRGLRLCRIDVSDPKVLPGGETLRVTMKTDRSDFKPGDSVDVHVRVKDREGRPAAAEVSLAAVDASVYAFGADRLSALAALFDDPHPAQRFHAKAWRSSLGNRWALQAELGKNSHEAIESLQKAAVIIAESKDGLGTQQRDGLIAFPPEPLLPVLPGELPVASIPLARLRADFRETAAWLPQLRTDANGELRTTFKLPDSLTRFRLSAVALTKTTKVGTARAEVQAALPLAVQVILPRFAVEGDRLAAVGLVHNNGPRDRTCRVSWKVEGAILDGQVDADVGTGKGQLMIPAGKSCRIGVWLKCDRSGSARVQFHCGDDVDSDAEMRSLQVQPLGRERSLSFDGAFTDATKVRLPAGFAARDVYVVLARNNVAQSLDGVAGLVEYPYGCAEQTMSRFLPAVLVREAARRGPLSLPPDVAAKLPLVLEQGLTRLYKFQHADGGWGWWEHDKTDPRMTVYVVYGLARCAGVGVRVDPEVLVRGSSWLKAALLDGRLTGPLAARAHLALAHAGQADAPTLRSFAEQLLAKASPSEARCFTALACKLAGLPEVAARLWATARDWQPGTTEGIALLLKSQLTFAEPLGACQRSGGQLMKCRTGLGWDHTQATAAALDALSLLIPRSAAETPPKAVRVTIGGKEELNLSRPEELKAPVYRVHLASEQLPIPDPLEIVLTAEGGAAIYYTVEAYGTQRQDKVEPIGDAIQVSRTFETLDGRPLAGKLTVGQTLAVRLRVVLENPRGYVLIEDRRPAGCEFADNRLHGKDAAGLANIEFRDDRVCAFAASLAAGAHEFVYYLRAETPGLSQVLPGRVYPMYEDRVRGETGAARLEIAPADRRNR